MIYRTRYDPLKQTQIFSHIVLLLLILPLSIVPFTPSQTSASPTKIGIILAETGDWATWGNNCHKGVALAAKPYAGTKQLELHYEVSDNALPKNALTAYRRLREKGVSIFLGPQSPEEVSALTPVVDREKTFLMSYASARLQSKNIFTMGMKPQEYGVRVAKQFIEKNYKKAAVLSSEYQWEAQVVEGFRGEYKKLGGEITLLEEPPPGVQEMSSQVLRLKTVQYDALFLPSYSTLELYLKELTRLKIKDLTPIYSVELDDAILKRLSPLLAGIIYLNPVINQEHSFTKEFITTYNTPPSIPAPHCFEGARILFEAVTKGITSTDALKQQFLDNTFSGALKSYRFIDGVTVFKTEFVRK